MKNNNNNNERSVILSAVRSYDFDCLQPFLISLDRVGYKGEVCFFVDDVTDQTVSKLKEAGVKVIPFKSLQFKIPFRNRKVYYYKAFSKLINFFRARQIKKEDPNRIENTSKYAARYLPITHSRFALYYNYLSKNMHKYDNVIVSDARDVVFQKHPFDFDIPEKVCFFQETEKRLIKECSFNGPWVSTGFGQDALDRIGDNYISCAGVTIGKIEYMLEYLDVMTQYLTIPDMCYKDGGSGLDQGVHNYIIYEKIIKDYKLYENEEGPVLTMGYMSEDEMLRNEEGLLINKNGQVINILHQYDRHDFLLKEVLDKLELHTDIMLSGKPKWSFF